MSHNIFKTFILAFFDDEIFNDLINLKISSFYSFFYLL